jgi:hypothetical protein
MSTQLIGLSEVDRSGKRFQGGIEAQCVSSPAVPMFRKIARGICTRKHRSDDGSLVVDKRPETLEQTMVGQFQETPKEKLIAPDFEARAHPEISISKTKLFLSKRHPRTHCF